MKRSPSCAERVSLDDDTTAARPAVATPRRLDVRDCVRARETTSCSSNARLSTRVLRQVRSSALTRYRLSRIRCFTYYYHTIYFDVQVWLTVEGRRVDADVGRTVWFIFLFFRPSCTHGGHISWRYRGIIYTSSAKTRFFSFCSLEETHLPRTENICWRTDTAYARIKNTLCKNVRACVPRPAAMAGQVHINSSLSHWPNATRN